jgi:hypothetical protein
MNVEQADGGDGGIRYSLLGTNNGIWTMSKEKSTDATAWSLLAA